MRGKIILLSIGYVLALIPAWSAALQLPNRGGDSVSDDPFQPGQRGGPVLAPQEPTRAPLPPPPAEISQPLPAPSTAQVPPPMTPQPTRSTLANIRRALPPGEKFGVTLRISADAITRIGGGDPEATDGGAIPGLAELTWGGETKSAGLWEDGQFRVHFMYSFGDTPQKLARTVLPSSSLDDPNHAFNIWEFWYEHFFPYNYSWLRGGILDYNDDFYRLPYIQDVFLNRTIHIGAETARLYSRGQPDISSYPMTGFGLRAKTLFSPNVYLMGAMYDGSTGPKSARYDMPKSDGYLFASEFGWQGDSNASLEGSKLAIGGWVLLKSFDNWLGFQGDGTDADRFLDTPAFKYSPKRYSYAWYAMGSWAIGNHVHLFLRAARGDNETLRYPETYAGGVVVKGLVPGRNKDLLGAGFAMTVQRKFAEQYRDLVYYNRDGISLDPLPGPYPESVPVDESVWELSYSMYFGQWLILQPNYQWIFQPGMQPYIDSYVQAGLRIRMTF